MKTKLMAAIALLAFGVMACELPFSSVDTVDGFTDTEVADNEVETVIEESSETDNSLFEDDFSDSGSGWDRSSFDGGLTDYEAGSYRILVTETNYSAWANPSRNYSDVSVEVDAVKIGGDDDNEFGIICRHANIDNFYVATISSDGFYGFLKRTDGDSLGLVNMENMLPSEAINLGDASNHIRLDCVGSTLTLYVNGEFVGETVDTSISAGDVGLYAGTFSVPGTDIFFDNFVVREP
jgi:hypothetical protein